MTYKELKELLIKASDAYYKDSKPIMSDYDFDMKLKELEQMEAKQGFSDDDSPTRKPGSDLTNYKTEKHNRPMLSLENTYTMDEVANWYNKLVKDHGPLEVVIERKLDGCSFAARYVNGELVKALSRGDGEVGEDLTQNLKELSDLKNIDKSFTGEVRGEIIMTKSVFAALNKNNEYANARNLTSGTLKLLDVEKFKSRPLKAYVYFLEDNENLTQREVLDYLQAVGFSVFPYIVAKNFAEIDSAIANIEARKNSEIVELDGAVMKINNRKLWKTIGGTAKVPHWAKAFKYEPEHANTVVNDIVYQVGRTGNITPVAILEPVFVSGSTVTRATLNNKDFIESMDVRVGDTVSIRKAAEIIPEIISVDKTKRPKDSKPTEWPKYCPNCNTFLVKEKEEYVDYICPNTSCPSRQVNRVMYFAKVMEIDGFGDILTEKLVSAGLIKSLADIYRLKNHRDEIIVMERMGEASTDNLLSEIEKSKTQKFSKLIAALGIPNVGQKMAKTITKKYNSLEKIRRVSAVDLMYIDGIGKEIAYSVFRFINDKTNAEMLNDLVSLGVNMSDEVMLEEKVDLDGLNFCITGALSIVREKYIELIEGCGGNVTGSVSKKTSYLVTNEPNPISSKAKKAKELNIPIISERQLIKMCNALELLKELGDE